MDHILTKRLARLTNVAIMLLTMASINAEERVEALVQRFAGAAFGTRVLSADVELTFRNAEGMHRNVGTLKLMKPNYALINLKGDYPVEMLASDGKSVFVLDDHLKYKQQKCDSRGANIDSPWFGLPFRYFFTQSISPFGSDPDITAKVQYSGEETIQGEVFKVLVAIGQKPMPYTARYYFGRDNLMHRSVVEFGVPPKQASFTATLTNIRTNSKMAVADFQFRPPENAMLDEGFEDKMLALGKDAPDFSLQTPTGRYQSLAEISKGKKAVLINFWFLSCPPCRKEFPEFERLYGELKTKGFEIIAINMGDLPRPVSEYIRQEHLTFPVLMGGKDDGKSVFRTYQVATYPASYIFDSDGKLVYKTTGCNLDQIRKTLASLGVK